MRKIRKSVSVLNINVIALIILLISPSIFAQKNEKNLYDILKNEEAIGINVPVSCYETIDSILDAGERLHTTYIQQDKKDLGDLCIQFSTILSDSFGFNYQIVQSFSTALQERVLDCNYYSVIFYTFLNRINGYKAYPILVPGHMFIRIYKPDGTYFNYETTRKENVTDSTLRILYGVTSQAERNGQYLCILNDSQLTAVHMAEMAYDISDTNLSLSIDILRKGLKFDNNSIHIYGNMSMTFYFKGQEDSTARYFDKAMALDSMNYELYFNFGKMFFDTDAFAESINYFDKAIIYNPLLPNLYLYRCYAYINQKNPEKAMADLAEGSRLIDKDNILSFFSDYPLLKALDDEILLLLME